MTYQVKAGDKVRCVSKPGYNDWLTVGAIYTIEAGTGDVDLIFGDIIVEGGMNFVNDDGEMLFASGLTGGAHGNFEVVTDEQTEALMQLLELSEQDVREDRVMTREELIDNLNKD